MGVRPLSAPCPPFVGSGVQPPVQPLSARVSPSPLIPLGVDTAL